MSQAAVLLILYLSLCYSQSPYREDSENALQAASTIVQIFVVFILLGTSDMGISVITAGPVVILFLVFLTIKLLQRMHADTLRTKASRNGWLRARKLTFSRLMAAVRPPQHTRIVIDSWYWGVLGQCFTFLDYDYKTYELVYKISVFLAEIKDSRACS